jgi:hypothetical protein
VADGIERAYPRAVRAELAELASEGPLVVSALPGSGAAELVAAVTDEVVVLRPRDAPTPLAFRVQFAQALVRRAVQRRPPTDTATSFAIPVVATLATNFGRRAADVAALAEGQVERDVTVAELASGLDPLTLVVVDQAHLIDAGAGREVLWALRDHRRVALVTRPWFVERLRRADAAFFGHGRTFDLSAVELRAPVGDADDAAFLIGRAVSNAELLEEVLERGKGNVRRGWDEAVSTRRSLTGTLLSAAYAVHPFGPTLLRAIARGDAPYSTIPDAPSARIATALRALRDNDMIYPPRPRHWRLADPAMAEALRKTET